MSVEKVEQFFEKVRGDEKLQARIASIDYHDQETATSDLLALAAEHGFSFTAADYRTAVRRRAEARHAAQEKGGAELDVAAGSGPFRRSDTEAGGGETCIVTDDCDYCFTWSNPQFCQPTEWPQCL